MMKVLRLSLYDDMHAPPHHTLVDIDHLEESVEHTIDAARYNEDMDGYVASEAIEIDDETLEYDAALGPETARLVAAWRVAMEHYEEAEAEERNRAILYLYDAQVFQHAKTGGVITGTMPAPLSVEEIKDVFRQLAIRKDYRAFTLQTISKDGQLVKFMPPDHFSVTSVHGAN